MYGHYNDCCSKWTQSKARKTLENTKDGNNVRDDEEDETSNSIHQVATDVHATGVHRINHNRRPKLSGETKETGTPNKYPNL